MPEYLPVELTSVIQSAVTDGYAELASERGEPVGDMPSAPICRPMTTILVLSLFEAGQSPRVDSRGGRLDEHRYVLLGDKEDEVVIDSTWQQFLPKDALSEDLPKVLIGSREAVIDFAVHAGVSAEDSLVWSADRVLPPYQTATERIAAAIDSAG